jgi:hypothetical protein
MLDPLDDRTMLALFRFGMDTATVAYAYGISQAEVANRLATARDAQAGERARDDAAFAAVSEVAL